MADMSDFLEVTLLNLSLNGTSWAGMNDPYISLHTADPTDAGTGTEVSTAGTSYARTAASFAVASGTSGAVVSDADATFPAATAGWGVVGWIGLWDASTAGNMLYHTALDASKTIDSGDIFKIASGNLTVTLA
tara:strand:- start:1238 stop:1636 length:399 start_codon:yes stop_codon:yes gene_type:complete